MREKGRVMMTRQDVELMVLMRDAIPCMTDVHGGVVVWEGAWEEERRRMEEQDCGLEDGAVDRR